MAAVLGGRTSSPSLDKTRLERHDCLPRNPSFSNSGLHSVRCITVSMVMLKASNTSAVLPEDKPLAISNDW